MIGMIAPDFQLQDGYGKNHRLSSHRGKENVVLVFYPQDFTDGWIYELQSLRDELTQIQEANATVYGISGDDRQSHREFQREYQFGFPLLADTDLEVSRLYSSVREDGNMSSRTTFVIDKAGYIRSVNRQVNIPEHGSEVLNAIRETTQSQIKVGQIAPNFVAYDEHQISYQLNGFKNKKNVVLLFSPLEMVLGGTTQGYSPWSEMSQINDSETQVLVILLPDDKSKQRLVVPNNLTFSLLVDSGRNLGLLFGAVDKKSRPLHNRLAICIDKGGKITQIESEK